MFVREASYLASFAAMALCACAADFSIPRCETYGTDFKLNGKLDDSAWQSAASRDFVDIQSTKSPNNRTTLRAFYDVDALYFAFECSEAEPARIQPGFPAGQATDVPIPGGADCAEIYISPPGAGNVFFQLRVVPSGAKADLRCTAMPDRSCIRDATWNGDWQVATSQDEKGWYAEVKVPFAMFAQGMFGLPVSTPAPGTRGWRLNAGRFASPRGETTGFSPLGGLYHWNMAECAFGGFPWGDMRVSAERHHVDKGRNVVPLEIENLSDKPVRLRVNAVFSETEYDGEKRREALRKCRYKKPLSSTKAFSGEVELAPRGKTVVEAAFDAVETDAGTQSLSVNVDWLRMKMNCARLTLKGGDDPGVRRRREDAAGPGRLAEQISRLRKTRPNDSFAVGTAPVYEKVFRDMPFTGSFDPTAKIALARNEYESAQFVVFRLKPDVGEIAVVPPRLVGPDGAEIPADAVEIHWLGFVNVGDSGHNTHFGYWPDVMNPGNALPQPKKGSLQSVIITVKAPRDQAAGTYRGKVLFAAEGERHEGELVVEVFPFALPDTMTLGMNIWFHGIYVAWFYDQFPFKEDFFKDFMTLCGKYRFANFVRCNMIEALLRIHPDETEEDGFRFDFSLIGKYHDISRSCGANALNFDVPGEKLFTKPICPIGVGKDGKLFKFIARDPAKARRRLFNELLAFYKSKGYGKYLQIQVGDEPWGDKAQEAIRNNVSRMREMCGELPPVITAGAVRHHTNLDGYVDIWCPQFPQYDSRDYVGMKPNERLWLYQCLFKEDFPSYQIDRPAIEPRITGLICRKTGARGFLYWTSAQWSSVKEWKEGGKAKDRWVHEEWTFPINGCPGDGCFVYPTKNGVVPSYRAVFIRDGVEDYEYVAELERRYAAAKANGSVPEKLDREVRRLLAVPDEVVRATNEWTHDVSVVDRYRREVAAAISALEEGRGR